MAKKGALTPEEYEEAIREFGKRLIEAEPETAEHLVDAADWMEFASQTFGTMLKYPDRPMSVRQAFAIWKYKESIFEYSMGFPALRPVGVRPVFHYLKGYPKISWYGYPEKRFISTEMALARIGEARRLGLLRTR